MPELTIESWKRDKKKIKKEKFYSQWYWQKSQIYPYKKSKAWYHGPRIEWMNLVKEKKNGRLQKSVQ